MPLVIEDGTGKADAESYADVAFADAYWAARGEPAGWAAATTDEKEEALRNGTEYLDDKFARRWQGYRSHEGQRLRWPRRNVVDLDGFVIHHNVIPGRIREATAYLANASLSDGLLFLESDPVSASSKTKELVKVGPITIEDGFSAGGATEKDSKTYHKAKKLVVGYLKPMGSVERA